jgi:arylsulfatase A-like enzyme
MAPNVVFVLADQWRAQAFGYAGDPNVKTPNIDALAENSINCVNTISVCPVCTPQRASLLTGRFPTSTGMFLNDVYLPNEEFCMADMFKAAGYDTAYVGKWHLDGHGRDSYIPPERRQGFDYWKVLECTHSYQKSHYYAGNDDTKRTWEGYDAYAQTRDAQQYIQDHANRDKPFLLFVGFGGPHFPHNNAPKDLYDMYLPESLELRPNVPEEFADHSRGELSGYYAHCTAIDTCVGDLLETVKETGISDDTIFVFTSDHGDMHGSQGKHSCRKQLPWDESLRVPFLMHYPPIHDSGREVTTTLNTPDILPSLLSLAGVDIPDTVEGEDVTEYLAGKAEDPDRAGLFMTVSPFAGNLDFKAFRGLRTSRYSYVADSDGPWLLYDNQEDPYQMDNRVDAPELAEMRTALDSELHRQLERNNDSLMTAEAAREKWGYTVKTSGVIPFTGEFIVQSPGPDGGGICHFDQ